MAKSGYEAVKKKMSLIKGWARDGLDNKQIAKNLGIGESTLYKYKKEHDELEEVLREGKEIVDFEVENALLKRAKGYEITNIRYVKTRIPMMIDGEVQYDRQEKVIMTEEMMPIAEVQHIPADVTACAIWLNNRKPNDWKRNRNKETLDDNKFKHQKEMDVAKLSG